MPARSPTKRRRKASRSSSQRSAAPKKRKPAKGKRSSSAPPKKRKTAKRKSSAPKKRKAAKRKSSAPKKPKPKLKKHKLIAPRKKAPKAPAPEVQQLIEHAQRQEALPPDEWKHIDPYADLDERPSFGGGDTLDEDEDRLEADPEGDPDAAGFPGFDRTIDLPPGMDVHDYIAWFAEEYDVDIGELYEMYLGYEED